VGEGRALDLTAKALSYELMGVTDPAAATWHPDAAGFRTFETTKKIGNAESWPALADAVKQWRVKTQSGFTVEPPSEARIGQSFWLHARIGPLTIHEPVRVVAEISESVRCGFAYGTLVGHPVSGEEAFVVHRSDDGVFLTLRSVTRPGAGLWRLLFPVILVAQRVYRRRYLRALGS
jgi:uncharacterized protein (UPF0548 family)